MAQAIDPAHLELILKTMGIENVKEVTKAYEDLAKSAKDSIKPIDEAKAALAEIDEAAKPATEALKDVAGTGEGETGSGGFAGAAAGALKFERAALGLATGHGLRGATNALEGLIGTLGGPAGVGLAIGAVATAIDVLLPKFVKWIEKIDGAAEAAARLSEKTKEAREQMEKFIEEPTAEEETGQKAVKELLKGRQGVLVAQGIEQTLRAQGVGLMEPGQRAISEAFLGPLATAEAERKQQDQQVAIKRAEIMKDLIAGRTPAISEISAMAGQFPGLFPAGTEQHFRQALPENIEESRRQSEKAQAVSEWAEETYKQREAAKAENIDIQVQFNRARRDKINQDAAQRERDSAVEEAASEADARHAKKESANAERARLKDERERKKASTPLAQMTRGVEEMAPGLAQQGFDVEGVAREALRQLPATGGNPAVAIQQAILAAYQRGLRMQQEDMARMQMFTEMMQGSR